MHKEAGKHQHGTSEHVVYVASWRESHRPHTGHEPVPQALRVEVVPRRNRCNRQGHVRLRVFQTLRRALEPRVCTDGRPGPCDPNRRVRPERPAKDALRRHPAEQDRSLQGRGGPTLVGGWAWSQPVACQAAL
jgi:hypothetical protein